MRKGEVIPLLSGYLRFGFVLRLILATTSLHLMFAGVFIGQAPSSTPVSEADLIHLGDVVDVDVVGSLDFDWRGTLTPEGYLNGLDKIEEQVYALCRSETDIGVDIARHYAKFLRDPKVVVRIVDRTKRALSLVDGAVKKPQRFQIRRPVQLSELIVLSGGITDRSNGEILVYRPTSLNCLEQAGRRENSDGKFIKAGQGNGPQTVNIRISDLLSGHPGSDPEILSGDIVTVAEAAPIFVIGGVNNPRQMSSRDQVSLSRAIASSGGLAKDAVEEQITIFRRDGRQSKVIDADLGKIRNGRAEDIMLKPFDIVSVGQKGHSKPKLPPSYDPANDRDRLVNLPVHVID